MPPNESTSTPASIVWRPQRGDVAAEGGGGVGDAGAVHVHGHPEAVGGVADGGDLVDRVERAELGALGDRHDARLGVVRVADEVGLRVEVGRASAWRRGAARSISLAPRMRSGAPVSSTAMCAQSVHTTASAGPSSDGQGEHVGAGAVEREQRRDVGAEQLAEAALALLRPRIVAVGRGVPVVGPGDRLDAPPDGRRRSCRWRTSARRRGQVHGAQSPRARPTLVGSERVCRAGTGTARLPSTTVSRRVGDGGRGAGPRRRAAADDGRAARRPGRARAPAARRVRHRRRPRRGRRGRRRDGRAAGRQARVRRASARCRRRSSATSPRSCARRPSGSASSAATSRSPATAPPSCPTCRPRSTPSTPTRSTPSSSCSPTSTARSSCSPATPSAASPCSSPPSSARCAPASAWSTAATSRCAASSPSPSPARRCSSSTCGATSAGCSRRSSRPRAPGYTIVALTDGVLSPLAMGVAPLVRHRRRVGVAVRQPRRHAGAVRPARRPGGRAAAGVGGRPARAGRGGVGRGPRPHRRLTARPAAASPAASEARSGRRVVAERQPEPRRHSA